MENRQQNNAGIWQIGILGILVFVSLSVHLYFSWRPLESLVAMFAGDDMFYYLQIARNIARGHGSTFDGTTLTNGYHPVYMLCVTSIFWLFPGHSPSFYAHASLTLLSIANVTTGLVLFLVCRQLFGRMAGYLVAAFWLLNPYILGTALIGVEVALAALMFAVSMSVYLRFSTQWMLRPARWLETYLLGILLGMTCLCRTDSMFFAVCLGLAILLMLYRSPHTPRSWRHWPIFVAGGATVIVPWFAWNLLRFGSIVQDSARALTSLKHTLYLQKHGWLGVITRKWPSTFSHWFSFLTDILCLPTVWLTLILLLFLAWVALRPIFATESIADTHHSSPLALNIRAVDLSLQELPQRAMLWALLAALCMSLLFYAGYFWFLQKWYFLSPTVLVAVLMGGLFGKVQRNPRIIGVMVVLMGGLFVWKGAELFRTGFYPWQKEYHDIAVQLKKMPKDMRLGAFNTGIYGYVMDRGVVNLDGVVNGQVLRAMKQKKLLAYLRQQGVTHIVDHLHAIQHFATFAEPTFRDSFRLLGRYRVATTGGDIVILELMPERR